MCGEFNYRCSVFDNSFYCTNLHFLVQLASVCGFLQFIQELVVRLSFIPSIKELVLFYIYNIIMLNEPIRIHSGNLHISRDTDGMAGSRSMVDDDATVGK